MLNTSPLIVLARLGVLEEALDLFSEVEVPRGVLEEIGRRKDDVYREVTRLVAEGRIREEGVKRRLPRLGLGESSAILLALNKGKVVALDDKRARRLARELGLEVVGTLSILRKLREEGLLREEPNTIYTRLMRTGFYVSKELFDKVLGVEDRRHDS